MKKNFLYTILMLTLICFDYKVAGENNIIRLKKTNSFLDLGAFYKEKKPVKNIYEQFEKFQEKNPSAKLPSYNVSSVLSVMIELFDLSQKIGYEGRKKGEETWFVIDTSRPVIERFANSLLKGESTKSHGYWILKDILKEYGKISHANGDKTKTNISNAGLDNFTKRAASFFDLRELNAADQNKIKEWIKSIAANYSGFQRIMLMMIILCIDFCEGVIIETPLKIKIEKIKEGPSHFSHSDSAIRLEESYFSEAQQWAPATLFHEVSHVVHYHICREYFYDNAIPFFVSSVSSSDALLDKFFPMLTKDNLDPEKNAVLRRIENAVKKEGISEKLLITMNSGKNIEEFDWRERTILNILYVIIGQGFGSILFGSGWENKTIVELLVPRNIALVLYVRALVFSTFRYGYWDKEDDPNLQSIDELKNRWLDLEEMLTIFGMIPFYFNNKFIVLEDRQNEQIFNLRNERERRTKVYRMHAESPSAPEMNTLLSKFFNQKGITFFNNDTERNKLVFPSKSIHIEDTSKGAVFSSRLFSKNSEDPLREVIFDIENSEYILHSLAELEKSEALKSLSDKITTEKVNELNTHGKTPLSVAVCNNNGEIVELFLSKGANLNTEVPYYKETPLHIAIRNGQKEMVEFLLDTGADPSFKSSRGETPLHVAAIKIIDDGAALEKLSSVPDARTLLEESQSLLAVCGRSLATARLLLADERTDPNAQNSQGKTPLHVAADNPVAVRPKKAFVELLLANEKTDPNVKDNWKDTPLHYAARCGNKIAAKLLLDDERTDPNIKNSRGETPLHAAVVMSNMQDREVLVELLLANKKTNPNVEDNWKNTPLHHSSKRKKAAKLLLDDERTDPNIKNCHGETPLHRAVHDCDTATIGLLLANKKTNPNIKDSSENTPLYYATLYKNKKIIKLLLGGGAKPNVENPSTETPADTAKDSVDMPNLRQEFGGAESEPI
ncbi:MAG: ankyrin repeat domain-containing protein [Holosporaceae bacterium]|jgi:ankyrin repeat protein|nr:ankyrin repeat domain-containing protein [Holosporaceae bacterium]